MASTVSDPLVATLVEQLRVVRQAERDIFGGLEPAVRDRPLRPGDWSPKDHQAHLTAWKGRQAERIRATRMGEPFPTDDREDDVINAELQATRADWTWEAIAAESDDISERLEAEIRAAGGPTLIASQRLVPGIFGNGTFHAITHLGWLVDAGIGVDEERLAAFIDAEERLLADAEIPDADRGTGLYNLACAHAVAGRLERARALLPAAFRLRPDLAEFAKKDPDLVELRDELAALA